MANIITGIIVVALVIGAVMTLTNASLSSASEISLSWNRMTNRTGDRARTELQLITADINGTGSKDVDISLRNIGQTALTDIPDWDVIIQYYRSQGNLNLEILRADYSTSNPPPHQDWTLVGIYLDADSLEAEVYEPNVFNPGEEMIIRVHIGPPPIPGSTDNRVTIGTANGVTLSAPFSR